VVKSVLMEFRDLKDVPVTGRSCFVQGPVERQPDAEPGIFNGANEQFGAAGDVL